MGCAAVVALIAVAAALGAALSALERALGLASARAAEVLNQLYANDLIRSVTFAFDGLLVTAVLLVIVAALSARRQSIGALRALGAPSMFVFVTVWLQGALLIGAGAVSGLVLGIGLAKLMGVLRQRRTRVRGRGDDRTAGGRFRRRAADRGVSICGGPFAAVARSAGGAPPSAPLTHQFAARYARAAGERIVWRVIFRLRMKAALQVSFLFAISGNAPKIEKILPEILRRDASSCVRMGARSDACARSCARHRPDANPTAGRRGT
jgi:hypothetical protein